MNTSVTWPFVFFIIFIFFCSLVYTVNARRKNELIKRRRIIDSLPNVISTLGVIGTFLGITMGLKDFNPSPDKIDASIAILLDGLKTAFYTSLAGMVGSVILRSFFTDKYFDKEEKGLTSAEIAAFTVSNQIKQMSEQMAKTINSNSITTQSMLTELIAIKSSQVTFFNSVQSQLDKINSQNLDAINTNFETLVLLNRSQESSLLTISKSNNVLTKAISTIEPNILSMTLHLNELLDIENGFTGLFQEQLDETKKFSEVLRSEVDEIEVKMTDTNLLLTSKFDEFSELLKKSNTEALVEVMTAVTEEFQKQMNALISRLIQDNFEQLNKNVENLNLWQQENREMITFLTSQYQEMTSEFEKTSQHLSKVSSDTKQLVVDGGKLSILIGQLNKVMVDDKKFTEISSKLEETASLTKDTMAKFDDSNKMLNDWFLKHRGFVDEVQKLVVKLDELNKIRDYSDMFWQETKRGMDDGVAFIKQGAESLNSQLTQLDRQFYSRLSTTLAELDSCIQAMVNREI